MSGALRLYLIRHGETAWSITGQHTRVTDLALTAHGEEQARALAPALRPIGFTRVLTSPSLRARQTCGLAGFGAGALWNANSCGRATAASFGVVGAGECDGAQT